MTEQSAESIEVSIPLSFDENLLSLDQVATSLPCTLGVRLGLCDLGMMDLRCIDGDVAHTIDDPVLNKVVGITVDHVYHSNENTTL